MRKLHQEELQADEGHGGMHYASQTSLKGCFGEPKLYVINERAGLNQRNSLNGNMTRSNDGAVRGRGWAARPALAAPMGQSKHQSTLGPRDLGRSAASLPAKQIRGQVMHKTVNHDDHPYANSSITALPRAVAAGWDGS
jgi:hypothetical protein